MQLSTMEDIAGVRAVLMNQRQVDEVRRCLEKAPRWNIRRVRDYVAYPKDDGYRAIHSRSRFASVPPQRAALV